MKICFIGLVFSMALAVQAQMFDEHHRVTLPLAFAAGAMYGYGEVLAFHYTAFDQVHPNANPQYWNPELSWSNKYKNGDPAQGAKFWGSRTIFVFTTDGYHLSRTLSRGFAIGCTIPIMGWKPENHWQVLREFAYLTVSYLAGFHLVYSVIYK